MTGYHEPVMLEEAVKALNVEPKGRYVDVTYGGGGHSKRILDELGDDGELLVFDKDEEIAGNLPEDPRLIWVDKDFRYLKNYLKYLEKVPVNGVLADLGVSGHHFDEEERGFSIRRDGPLDMRMDRRKERTAEKVLNEYPKEELVRIFKEYGEIKKARKVVGAILAKREKEEMKTTKDLKDLLEDFAPRGKENKFHAQAFQAVRMEVNDEIMGLEDMLKGAGDVLEEGGRLVVLSYHSLEDRIVKRFMRSGNFKGEVEKDIYGNPLTPLKPVNKKPIVASEEELGRNPRARSAKMRIAEKTGS